MAVSFYPCQNDNASTIVFSAGLGGHAQFWQPQIAFFNQHYHVLCYDHAGINQDDPLLPHGYSMQDMAKQLIAILDERQLSHCNVVGHALGGFIGLEVARLRPELIHQLVFINVWDQLDPHTSRCFATRLELLCHAGHAAYVQAQALFLYPPAWISEHHQQLAQQEQQMIEHFAPITNVLKRIEALRLYQPQQALSTCQHRSLVLINQDDFLVPWQRGFAFAKALTNAEVILLASGAHASTVTDSTTINHHILNFLNPTLS